MEASWFVTHIVLYTFSGLCLKWWSRDFYKNPILDKSQELSGKLKDVKYIQPHVICIIWMAHPENMQNIPIVNTDVNSEYVPVYKTNGTVKIICYTLACICIIIYLNKIYCIRCTST